MLSRSVEGPRIGSTRKGPGCTPQRDKVEPKVAGAFARWNRVAKSNSPPMPMVLLMTKRPMLVAPLLTCSCSASLTTVGTSARLLKKLCTPARSSAGKAPVAIRHRQKEVLIETRIEPVGETVRRAPTDHRCTSAVHRPIVTRYGARVRCDRAAGFASLPLGIQLRGTLDGQRIVCRRRLGGQRAHRERLRRAAAEHRHDQRHHDRCFSSCWLSQRPSSMCQHVRDLLALAEIAQVAAVIVNHDAGTQRGLQPRQFGLVENQVVAVGLRVVVRIVAQRVADDVQVTVRPAATPAWRPCAAAE